MAAVVDIRVWRSLVSRLNGVQEALSSNLNTRTREVFPITGALLFFVWCSRTQGLLHFKILFTCFFAQQVFEQDAHVIAAAIEDTVNVDITALRAVEHHIIAADKKTIVRSDICN